MIFIRRVLVVLGIAGLAATVLRIGGRTENRMTRGGWTRVSLRPKD